MNRLAILAAGPSACADALSRQLARLGYRVLLPHLSSASLSASLAAPGGEAGLEAASSVPMAGPDEARAASAWLELAETRHGPVDVLIYQAALDRSPGLPDALLHLVAPLHARMRQRRRGRLLLLAPPGTPAAQQAGLQALMRQLAQDALGQGVTVNLITGANPPARRTDALPEEAEAGAAAHLSQAEEIAGLAVYLASEEAGAVSGAHFCINGPGPASSPP